MKKYSGFVGSEHILEHFDIKTKKLKWDSLKTQQDIGLYCTRVDHETVGPMCHCRCGTMVFEPWEMPQTDAVYTFIPATPISGTR